MKLGVQTKPLINERAVTCTGCLFTFMRRRRERGVPMHICLYTRENDKMCSLILLLLSQLAQIQGSLDSYTIYNHFTPFSAFQNCHCVKGRTLYCSRYSNPLSIRRTSRCSVDNVIWKSENCLNRERYGRYNISCPRRNNLCFCGNSTF